MEIIWSKTARQVLTVIPYWEILSNWFSVAEARIARPREWKSPCQRLFSTDWMDPNLSGPLEIAPLIQALRERFMTPRLKRPNEPSSLPRIGEEIGLTELAAEHWDYLTAITHASYYSNRWSGLGLSGEWVFGPFCTRPTYRAFLGTTDDYSVTNITSVHSAGLAARLCSLDSPLHNVSLMEVTDRDLPGGREQGNVGLMQVGVVRAQRAADFYRLYRLQAALMDIGMVWPLYLMMAEIAREHGSCFADEIDATKEVVADLMTYRHPMIRLVHGTTTRLRAQTPDGPADVICASKDLYHRLTRRGVQDATGWIQIFGEMRNLASQASANLRGVDAQSVSAGWPNTPRMDLLEFCHRLRPVLKARGDSMRRIASSMWSGAAEGEGADLLFNQPPVALTDGINASATASAVVAGLRQLVPIAGPALQYHIAREMWTWREWGLIPVEREESPGDLISPPTGVPRDMLPACMYMGESGAIEQPSASIVHRLEQFGMTSAVGRLAGINDRPWPKQAGDVEWKDAPTAVEAIGDFRSASQEADLLAMLEKGVVPDINERLTQNRYFVRPDGFAERVIVRRTHPEEYHFVNNHSILPKPMRKLWFKDWPVTASEMRMPYDITRGISLLLDSAIPALKA